MTFEKYYISNGDDFEIKSLSDLKEIYENIANDYESFEDFYFSCRKGDLLTLNEYVERFGLTELLCQLSNDCDYILYDSYEDKYFNLYWVKELNRRIYKEDEIKTLDDIAVLIDYEVL